ncbi:unnamed protein product [Periconia digitata]|uniref:Uncharacterized protein n=1 Tax=Periconia digitata TaxID=1303443 RepID=A0A9W4UT98_9PLEO|nr:unnamed protein product [Periconia digitata]
MWKRLQGHGREREKQIGHPVLVETTFDQDRLRHIPNIGVAQNASYQSAASPISGDQNLTTQYLDYPQYPNDNRASEVPTVSSVYSQPSPGFGYDYNAASNMRYSVDISPPSSPELQAQRLQSDGPRRYRSMRDVSPVDENRGREMNPSPRNGSNIPVLRKVAPAVRGEDQQSTQKFWGGKVAPNAKVRWDEYSGEPTSSNVGKSGQVNPRTFSHTALSPPADERQMGYQVSVSGPETTRKAPLAERANRFGRRPSPVDTKPREPWSLASGRNEIVKPFKDQPSEKPLNFVRKLDPAKKQDQGVADSLATTTKHQFVRSDTAVVADSLDNADMHQKSIKPVVPLKVGRYSPNNTGSPITPQNPRDQAIHSYPSPITPTNKQSPVASSYVYGAARNEVAGTKPVTPTTAGAPRKSVEGTPESTATKESGPKSRFSWTTYNSGTTYQHSPPPSPPPPLPTSNQPEPAPAAVSVLDRKRPIPSSDNRIPSRKPVAESTVTIMQTQSPSPDPPSPRPESTFSSNPHKALPRPPPELAAADHIEALESQMEDLRVRRSNVYRLLNDLNNMAPPNPMITDFKRMRLVEQRKKDFENELAEIKVEEHDVGLKLHRAFRKREKNDPNGGSALWVRRVTS